MLSVQKAGTKCLLIILRNESSFLGTFSHTRIAGKQHRTEQKERPSIIVGTPLCVSQLTAEILSVNSWRYQWIFVVSGWCGQLHFASYCSRQRSMPINKKNYVSNKLLLIMVEFLPWSNSSQERNTLISICSTEQPAHHRYWTSYQESFILCLKSPTSLLGLYKYGGKCKFSKKYIHFDSNSSVIETTRFFRAFIPVGEMHESINGRIGSSQEQDAGTKTFACICPCLRCTSIERASGSFER